MNARVSVLREELRAFWQRRSAGERLMIAVCAAVLGIGLCLWSTYAIEPSRTQLRSALVPSLRERAGLLERQAAEYDRLRETPAAAVSQTDIQALVQAQVGAA